MRRPNIVGRINHFKHREGMGCAILVVYVVGFAGLLALAMMLPILVNHPWFIFVGGFIWLGYHIFQGYTANSQRRNTSRFTIGPTAKGFEWIHATLLEKTEYVTRSCREMARQDGGNADPTKVIMGMDEYFRQPSNLSMGVSFAFGMAFASVNLLCNYDSRLGERTE